MSFITLDFLGPWFESAKIFRQWKMLVFHSTMIEEEGKNSKASCSKFQSPRELCKDVLHQESLPGVTQLMQPMLHVPPWQHEALYSLRRPCHIVQNKNKKPRNDLGP